MLEPEIQPDQVLPPAPSPAHMGEQPRVDDAVSMPAGTTHADWGAGAPRLLVSGAGRHGEFALVNELTCIGSALDCDIRIDGLEPTHATVVHNDRDEYLLRVLADGETTTNPDPDGVGADRDIVLRTGSQFRVGGITFVFQREEFADHGRPFGGRQGGEYAEQPAQPRRPNYREGETASTPRPLERQDS